MEMGSIAGNIAKTVSTPDECGKTTIDKLKDLSNAKKAALAVMLTSPAAVLAHDIVEKQSDETKEKIKNTGIAAAALLIGTAALAFVTGKGLGAKNTEAIQKGASYLFAHVKDGAKAITKGAKEIASNAKIKGGEIFKAAKAKAGDAASKVKEGLDKVKTLVSEKFSKVKNGADETALAVIK